MRSLLKITLVLLFTFTLFSCTNDDDNPKKTEKKSTYEDLKKIAKLHNEGLDYIYNEIIKIESNKRKDEINAKFFVDKTVEFLNKQNVNYHLDKSKLLKRIKEKYPNLTYDKERSKEFFEETLKKFNPTQRSYIRKIVEIETGTIPEIQQKIQLLMRQLDNDKSISHKQKECIYLVAGVAHHSIEYWYNNKNKWKEHLTARNSKLERYTLMAGSWNNVDWGDVAFEDCEGVCDGAEDGAEIGLEYGAAIGAAVEGIGYSAVAGYASYNGY